MVINGGANIWVVIYKGTKLLGGGPIQVLAGTQLITTQDVFETTTKQIALDFLTTNKLS